MEKTSHTPTPLEQLINNGYKEITRTPDGEWVTLERKDLGIVYDIKRDVIVYRYKKEDWK